jgi:hypothetical protein
MNCKRWNYNWAFYYYHLIAEKIYKINKSFILKRHATGKQIFR